MINKTTSGVMAVLNNKMKLIIRQSYGFRNFYNLREKLLACLFIAIIIAMRYTISGF
ncbi:MULTISPECIES: transposase [Moorena]|uniref:transposase n=1 Tax=Moorena TaxID=1155738 RepID=UPI0022771586|nr:MULTISPECIES: transposase [Moorena]